MKKLITVLFCLCFVIVNLQYVQAQEKSEKLKASTFVNAINNGDIDTVKRYIEQGMSPNKTFMGATPLTYAIDKHQNEILDYLLKNGANPNIESGVPPLYYAVVEKNKYATAKLLKAGANPKKTYMTVSAKDLAATYKTSEFSEIFNSYEKNPIAFNPELYKFGYSADNEDNQTLSANVVYNLDKKDTNLILVQKTKPINMKAYNQKVKNDYIEYQKNKKQLKEEQYALAVILDKLLRANKLQYQNWRIGVEIETQDVNAYAGSANLIIINSSLYDSLYQNQDALAFIVAHELSHLILGHNQIALENSTRIKNLEQEVQKTMYEANRQNNLADFNNAIGNYGSALGNSVSSLAYSVAIAAYNSEINKIFKQERELEMIADSEALVLMTRAGYDPNKAKETLEFLSNLPNIYTKRSTHPDTYTRQSNINENLFLNDNNELKNQGRKEILNSKVLQIKKSSDKKTIVLSKGSNYAKYQYVPISKEDKLIKKAYSYYLDNDNQKAKDLFAQAYMMNPNNFIPALYLSYINEYDFKQTQQKKLLKQARKWAKKASRLRAENKFVKKQNEDIKEILVNLRVAKKKK